jgi:hypothetical protein
MLGIGQHMLHVFYELGFPFFSIQLDMWTSDHSHISYACLTATMVVWQCGRLVITQYVLAFERFLEKHHTAVAIKRWVEAVLKRYGLSTQGIELSTLDGAANGIKAMVMLKLLYRICGAHQLQRCIKHATGQAGGKTSSNPEFKQHLHRVRNIDYLINKSNIALAELKEAQEADGIKETTTVSKEGHTRWDGMMDSAARKNSLMKYIGVNSASTHWHCMALLSYVVWQIK